jgi:rRNA maturation endonuclease Nob1
MEERVYISSDEQVLVDCDTRTKIYELKNFKYCPYCGKPTEIEEV